MPHTVTMTRETPPELDELPGPVLHRASCSCGWQTAGLSPLTVPRRVDAHLARAQRADELDPAQLDELSRERAALTELLREPAPDYDAARPGCCGGCYYCQHS